MNFSTVVLEKTFESPLDSRTFNQSILKEISKHEIKAHFQWVFTIRTDVEAETPALWPPDAKNWLTGKDPDAG